MSLSLFKNGKLIKIAGKYYLNEREAFLLAHPIGSYYMSENSTSPAQLYGGSWEKIEGRVLLGASASYPTGKEDGSATHTLTVNEMPSHTHTQNAHSHTFSGKNTNTGNSLLICTGSKAQTAGPFSTVHYGKGPANSGGWWEAYLRFNYTPSGTIGNTTATNQNTGGGQAHNNMMPYRATNIWYRYA